MPQIKTYTGTKHGFKLFRTELEAAADQLYEWVTGDGNNTFEEALEGLAQGRDTVLAEMADAYGAVHQELVDAWETVAAEVRAQIQADIVESLILQFLHLPVEAMPSATWLSGDALVSGFAALRGEDSAVGAGDQLLLRADREGWRDGRIVEWCESAAWKLAPVLIS